MKSLEERQKEWDERYDNPNSKEVKSRPARPSKEEDDLNDNQVKTIINATDLLKKKLTNREEEEVFNTRSGDGGELNYRLTNLIYQEIDFELKRCLTDRSTRIVSLTKETPYGIAHFNQLISISEIANNRLSFIIEQGISDINIEEKKLYERRREYTIPGQVDFFNRRY